MSEGVRAYLRSVPQDRRERLLKLHELILQLYPDAGVDMHYKMPTYRYGSGWVAIANQQNYISLYTCSAEHLTPYIEKHPQQKHGKGCINFSDRDEIRFDDVAEVIRHAIEHSEK